MTLQEVLNADMTSIGRWLRQGLRWWFSELGDMIPPGLRKGSGPAARWLAQMSSDDASIALWRDGVLQEVLRTPQAVMRPVDLLLPFGSVLVQELELPRLSGADLRRLVELNIDRYTPFSAEKVYFDARPVAQTAKSARQRVRLAVISRERGRAALEHASAMGLKVQRLAIGSGPDGRTPEFDFMRVVKAEAGGDPAGRRRGYLWAGCAVLLGLNVLVAIGRDMGDLAQLQRLSDLQQPTVNLALKLRRTVAAERVRRVALLTRRSAHEPLRILDAVTRALPKGQWVQRFEWNGRAARLVGFRQPGFDMLAALPGPALTAPRSLLADMTAKTSAGDEPFDVTADAVAYGDGGRGSYSRRPPR